MVASKDLELVTLIIMSESIFSTYWYRVSSLRPALRDSAQVSRHIYRGQIWYVVRNTLTGRNHRFNTASYALIGQMDGQKSVQQLWDSAGKNSAEEVPTQDEVIRLLGQLHEADLIQSDILPSTVELFNQVRGEQNRTLKKQISNPFSLKFPLWNPERFLERWESLVSRILTRNVFILWLLVVLSALVMAVLHWPELTGRLSDQLYSPKNLFLLWLVYPVVKVFHELGHAFAVKKWGGEVHEMGIILLALTPVPYVEASSSASFSDKKRRIAVAAMGMIVELLLASLAMFVWLSVEPGLISALAYNVMLIGGVSTVLFNGNPLLRYDGYYMLVDLVEIPNLGQRSTRYLGYLLQKYVFGFADVSSPVTAPGEKRWYAIYGPISFIYRMMIMAGLVLLVSSRFFTIGILIAIWGVISLLVLPAVRTLSQFFSSPVARNKRSRVIAVAASFVLGIILLLFVFPLPLWTTTQGVVWLPEQSAIRAGIDCEVAEVLAPVEQPVDQGMPLIRCIDPFLQAEIEVLEAHLQELYATYNALPLSERVKRKMTLDEIELLKGDLNQRQTDQEKLLVRSPSKGNFILVDAPKLPGRFIHQGDLLGYIVAEHRPTVRAVVRQADIGLVRERITGVKLRLAEQMGGSLAATIERIVPAADINLPTAALGTTGGGSIQVDPTDPEGLRALDTIFQLDINLPEQIANPHIGERVYVKFEHGTMPLAMQWYRSLRQLFLRKYFI